MIGGLGGGAVGAVLTKLLGDHYTQQMEEQVAKGGLLLWVRTPDHEKEELAQAIMKTHNAHSVHVHQIL